MNQNDVVEGSRASGMIDWHLLNYTKSEPLDGGWQILDTDLTSACDPACLGVNASDYRSGTGAITVMPLTAAETEAFLATYDLSHDTWIIKGASGVFATANNSVNGNDTIWHANVGGKISVTIKFGMLSFGH